MGPILHYVTTFPRLGLDFDQMPTNQGRTVGQDSHESHECEARLQPLTLLAQHARSSKRARALLVVSETDP